MFVNMTLVGFEPSSPYSESKALPTAPWRMCLNLSVVLYDICDSLWGEWPPLAMTYWMTYWMTY